MENARYIVYPDAVEIKHNNIHYSICKTSKGQIIILIKRLLTQTEYIDRLVSNKPNTDGQYVKRNVLYSTMKFSREGFKMLMELIGFAFAENIIESFLQTDNGN